MVSYQNLLSPDPEYDVIGYGIEFGTEGWYELHPEFELRFTDVSIGNSVLNHTYNPIQDVEAVSNEVMDYFSSLNEDNLYHFFEMNQAHFEGTSLELIFDNISQSPMEYVGNVSFLEKWILIYQAIYLTKISTLVIVM